MKKIDELELEDRVIFVKDKDDVLKASEILERVGIIVFSTQHAKEKFILTGDDVKNNFLTQESGGGWRIQSHYLGFGTKTDLLEEKVNEVLLKNPNLINFEILKGVKEELDNMKNKFSSIEEKLSNLNL